MNINDLPEDIKNEVKLLASQYPFTIETVLNYYLMGGYKHAEYLLSLKMRGFNDDILRMINQDVWDRKNKSVLEERLNERI